MARKQTAWKTKGMNRDLSVSAFNPEFAFENMNLRLSTNEGNTTMSWVNEKGTLALTINSISVYDRGNKQWEAIESPTVSGTPLGTAVLNHQLILFVHDSTSNSSPDYIYKFVYAENDTTKTHMEGYILYNGNLKFDTDYPIETLVSYESENVQKVYWTDNKNQPRLINIAADLKDVVYNDTSFDFVCELSLNETIKVEKKLNANGMFAPGVIQYAFTYYHKNGQESNIFYTTPLYYISYSDRGASPEQKVVENAFKINIENVDTNFEYLRIYSIQRTSLNGTPICKRIQDIYIKDIQPVNGEVNASYLDTGTSGDIIDPTELLFKGGEEITAKTMEQKDNTLFLGNIKMKSHVVSISNTNIGGCSVNGVGKYRYFYANKVSTGNYYYANQLTAHKGVLVNDVLTESDISVPCAGFKNMDYYRCGVQFQHKSGKWSDPVWIDDAQVEGQPDVNDPKNLIKVPILQGILNSATVNEVMEQGYLMARAIVVYPKINDRVTLCQGVVCPTMSTQRRAAFDKDLHAQSSWFFRPYLNESKTWVGSNGTAVPVSEGGLLYTDTEAYMPQSIRRVEIEGKYSPDNKFSINFANITFHSPDIEYDESMQASNFTGLEFIQIGKAKFSATFSDIDIQTETPTISSNGSGFVHKSFVQGGVVGSTDYGAHGIIAGLFYDDYIVDDDTNSDDKRLEKWPDEKSPVKWMVYPWNKNGSLNNDMNRPTNKGIASSILKKKVISNLRYADTVWTSPGNSYSIQPYLFNSEEDTILKAGDKIYQGNIDVLLYPDLQGGSFFAFGGDDGISGEWGVITDFNSDVNWKTDAINEEGKGNGLYKHTDAWRNRHNEIGNGYPDLVIKRESVRMKYKSTSHLFFTLKNTGNITWDSEELELCLPILDIRKSNIDTNTLFGGRSKDAFRENVWIPCGEPVRLVANSSCTFLYEYGDTYYQRWDCLKTYPFTREDPNQIVEIGSFMLETRANIDGRYDRNRGQINNLNMSPVNFNLYNPVYSQLNNFFSYRITETDEDNATEVYPNQVTWTVTKQSDSDVDPWTTITLASVMELDGNKGSLNKLVRFNDQLIAFQDTGISQILYNENIQISSADGVPIEIANSGKVQGKRYLSNSIGCSNKWALTTTPSGIYFMDSNDKGIYMFNGQLQNLSVTFGFNSWAKKNIPTTVSYTNKDITWEPLHFNDFVAYYDQRNQDVLFINSNTALAFSEKLGVFTSFYDYGNTPFLCNFEDTGIWIDGECGLYKHNAGGYCNFFGTSKPYWMTLIGNPEPQMDKIFTNLEFRACVDGDGTVDQQTDKFTPTLPFDSLETWNEYQHGVTTLSNRNGHSAMKHHTSDGDSSLKRKFRIWRCDIPRDNATAPENDTERNIYRKNKHPLDRMRNPWLYLKLLKSTETNNRTEVHDIMMTYFG